MIIKRLHKFLVENLAAGRNIGRNKSTFSDQVDPVAHQDWRWAKRMLWAHGGSAYREKPGGMLIVFDDTEPYGVKQEPIGRARTWMDALIRLVEHRGCQGASPSISSICSTGLVGVLFS